MDPVGYPDQLSLWLNLETRLDELLQCYDSARGEVCGLQLQRQQWEAERTDLLRRQGEARVRVASLISRLQFVECS